MNKTAKEREQEIAEALATLISLEDARMIAWYLAQAEMLSMKGSTVDGWNRLRTSFVLLMVAGLQEPQIEAFLTQIQLNGRPLN